MGRDKKQDKGYNHLDKKSLLEFDIIKVRISSISEHTLIGRMLHKYCLFISETYPNMDLVFQSSF